MKNILIILAVVLISCEKEEVNLLDGRYYVSRLQPANYGNIYAVQGEGFDAESKEIFLTFNDGIGVYSTYKHSGTFNYTFDGVNYNADYTNVSYFMTWISDLKYESHSDYGIYFVNKDGMKVDFTKVD